MVVGEECQLGRPLNAETKREELGYSLVGLMEIHEHRGDAHVV